MISLAQNMFNQAGRALEGLGMGARVAAIGLFVLNAVAVLSLGDVAEAALQQHVFWGSLLIALVLWGPGRFSLDAWWSAAGTRRLA